MGWSASNTVTANEQEKRDDVRQHQQPDDNRAGLATTVQVEIEHASAATVWKVVTDIGHKPDFVPCIESITLMGDREFKVGLQWKEHREEFHKNKLGPTGSNMNDEKTKNDKEEQQRPLLEQLRTVVRLEDDGDDIFPKSFSESITMKKYPSVANTHTWTVYPTAGADDNEEPAGCILLLSIAFLLDPPCTYCCCVPTRSPRVQAKVLDWLESYSTQELRDMAAEAERREAAATSAEKHDDTDGIQKERVEEK